MSENTYYFMLIFEDVEHEFDELEDALFDAGCDDALISTEGAQLTLEFDREGSSFREAFLSAIQDVLAADLKMQLRRVGPDDLVTSAEIARRASVSREAVRLWSSSERREGFPTPLTMIGKQKVWSWKEVAAWLLDHEKVGQEVVDAANLLALFNQTMDALYARPSMEDITLTQSVVHYFRPAKRAS